MPFLSWLQVVHATSVALRTDKMEGRIRWLPGSTITVKINVGINIGEMRFLRLAINFEVFALGLNRDTIIERDFVWEVLRYGEVEDANVNNAP